MAQQRPATRVSSSTKGRQKDDQLQKFFLNLIKPLKLEVINFESETEIACEECQDQNPSIYTDRELKGKNDDYRVQKIHFIRSWFKFMYKHNSLKYDLLWKSFIESADLWQYKEIHSEDDFPQYLFCSQCDLSYVLYSALRTRIPRLESKTQFENDELLFLELICLASRDMIPFSVLNSFHLHYPYILQKMKDIKDQMMSLYRLYDQQNVNKKIKKSRMVEQETNYFIDSFIFREEEHFFQGDLIQFLNQIEEKEKDIKETNKTKPIRKETKRGVGRPSKKRQLLKVIPPADLSQQKLELILSAMISHIKNAYRYILPEEIIKKAKRGTM